MTDLPQELPNAVVASINTNAATENTQTQHPLSAVSSTSSLQNTNATQDSPLANLNALLGFTDINSSSVISASRHHPPEDNMLKYKFLSPLIAGKTIEELYPNAAKGDYSVIHSNLVFALMNYNSSGEMFTVARNELAMFNYPNYSSAFLAMIIRPIIYTGCFSEEPGEVEQPAYGDVRFEFTWVMQHSQWQSPHALHTQDNYYKAIPFHDFRLANHPVCIRRPPFNPGDVMCANPFMGNGLALSIIQCAALAEKLQHFMELGGFMNELTTVIKKSYALLRALCLTEEDFGFAVRFSPDDKECLLGGLSFTKLTDRETFGKRGRAESEETPFNKRSRQFSKGVGGRRGVSANSSRNFRFNKH